MAATKKLPSKMDNPVPDDATLDVLMKDDVQKYLIINLISRRATELKLGARPLVRIENPTGELQVAEAEGRAGFLRILRNRPDLVAAEAAEAAEEAAV